MTQDHIEQFTEELQNRLNSREAALEALKEYNVLIWAEKNKLQVENYKLRAALVQVRERLKDEDTPAKRLGITQIIEAALVVENPRAV